MNTRSQPSRIGIIANPVSARDVRRILSNAAGLTLAERTNMLLRIIHTLAACAVEEILLMPEREGLRALLERQLQRHDQHHSHPLPTLIWLDQPVSGSVHDTFTAAETMHRHGVAAIMVLGGDGTHRAVVKNCADTPIAGISSGTNNAFPPMREVTVTALAVGLFATGHIPPHTALRSNKCLCIKRFDTARTLIQQDLALVDVGILNEQILGAKAIGDTETLRTILVTQASPEAVGLSAVAAMLSPLPRHAPGGLVVELQPKIGSNAAPDAVPHTLLAAFSPGLIAPLQVLSWQTLTDTPYRLSGQNGLIALDGERELSFRDTDTIEISLQEQAFRTVDVAACMAYAAAEHLLFNPSSQGRLEPSPKGEAP